MLQQQLHRSKDLCKGMILIDSEEIKSTAARNEVVSPAFHDGRAAQRGPLADCLRAPESVVLTNCAEGTTHLPNRKKIVGPKDNV